MMLDHGVFNVALQTLLDKDRKKCPHLRVPLILQEVRLTGFIIMLFGSTQIVCYHVIRIIC